MAPAGLLAYEQLPLALVPPPLQRMCCKFVWLPLTIYAGLLLAIVA